MLCQLSKTVTIGLFKAKACNKNVAGFFISFVKLVEAEREKEEKVIDKFRLVLTDFLPHRGFL